MILYSWSKTLPPDGQTISIGHHIMQDKNRRFDALSAARLHPAPSSVGFYAKLSPLGVYNNAMRALEWKK